MLCVRVCAADVVKLQHNTCVPVSTIASSLMSKLSKTYTMNANAHKRGVGVSALDTQYTQPQWLMNDRY